MLFLKVCALLLVCCCLLISLKFEKEALILLLMVQIEQFELKDDSWRKCESLQHSCASASTALKHQLTHSHHTH